MIKDLTEEETEKMKETSSKNPLEYRLFHLIPDDEKLYQEDKESATLMLLERTIYLVRFPGAETMNLDFNQVEWIKDRATDITFIAESGFDLVTAMGHQAHVLDRS